MSRHAAETREGRAADFKRGVNGTEKREKRANQKLEALRVQRRRGTAQSGDFEALLRQWNPQSLAAEAPPLEMLARLLYSATEDDMEQHLPQIVPLEACAHLVQLLGGSDLKALAAVLASLTFFRTSHERQYALALCRAGYLGAVFAQLQRVPLEEELLRCALWEPVINVTLVSPEAAADVAASELVTRGLPLEMELAFAQGGSRVMRACTLSVAAALLEELGLARSQGLQPMAQLLWGRVVSAAAGVERVESWKDGLTDDGRIVARSLVSASHIIVCLAYPMSGRSVLFPANEAAALEQWLSMLVHHVGVADVPLFSRRQALQTLCDVAATPLDALVPALFRCGAAAGATKAASSSHAELRCYAMHLIGNMASSGSEATHSLLQLGAVHAATEAVARDSNAVREVALFALGAALKACQWDYQHRMERSAAASDLLHVLVVRMDVLRHVPYMLDPRRGPVVLCDALQLLEAALRWNAPLTRGRMEQHATIDPVERLELESQNPQVCKAAADVSNLYYNRTAEDREALYLNAPVTAGSFKF